jgi:hypothetical protein
VEAKGGKAGGEGGNVEFQLFVGFGKNRISSKMFSANWIPYSRSSM